MTALLLVSAALAVSADTPAVAFALEVRGGATVERAGKAVELEDGDPIREGDKLTVKADGGVTVYFRPAGPVAVLNGPADATVRPGKLDTTATVVVRDVKVPQRAADGLNRDVKADLIGGLTLRAFDLPERPVIHPAAGRAVVTLTPSFSWPAVEGAKGYRVELDRIVTKVPQKVWEAEATANRFPYPEGKRPLTRDAKNSTYVWRVTPLVADGGAKPVVEAKFVVLDEAAAAAVADLAPLEASADPTDWLIAARAYSGLGLTAEPTRLLEKVAEKRPGSAIVWRELAKHYEAAGRTDDQEKALTKAGELAPKK